MVRSPRAALDRSGRQVRVKLSKGRNSLKLSARWGTAAVVGAGRSRVQMTHFRLFDPCICFPRYCKLCRTSLCNFGHADVHADVVDSALPVGRRSVRSFLSRNFVLCDIIPMIGMETLDALLEAPF
jgi:hypothetical protein